jgi:rhodanese-related sulfurtransferase
MEKININGRTCHKVVCEMKRRIALTAAASLCLLLCACGNGASSSEGVQSEVRTTTSAAANYQQITQEKAKKMMQADDGHIIVDVRRQDEYDSGHIPGAIFIPNESIGTEQPKELPDLDQVILIYCRSGRRSKEASQKLADMGYTHIYEFGGIIDWTGEVVTSE